MSTVDMHVQLLGCIFMIKRLCKTTHLPAWGTKRRGKRRRTIGTDSCMTPPTIGHISKLALHIRILFQHPRWVQCCSKVSIIIQLPYIVPRWYFTHDMSCDGARVEKHRRGYDLRLGKREKYRSTKPRACARILTEVIDGWLKGWSLSNPLSLEAGYGLRTGCFPPMHTVQTVFKFNLILIYWN